MGADNSAKKLSLLIALLSFSWIYCYKVRLLHTSALHCNLSIKTMIRSQQTLKKKHFYYIKSSQIQKVTQKSPFLHFAAFQKLSLRLYEPIAVASASKSA